MNRSSTPSPAESSRLEGLDKKAQAALSGGRGSEAHMRVTGSPERDDVAARKATLAGVLQAGVSLAACQGLLASTADADLGPRLNSLTNELDGLIDELLSRLVSATHGPSNSLGEAVARAKAARRSSPGD
jgi:hypothetical protein